jgi:transposase
VGHGGSDSSSLGGLGDGELFWLNDRQWAPIARLLPHLGGTPRVDSRRVISGILPRHREGQRWRAIPAEYGPRSTLFNRCSARGR